MQFEPVFRELCAATSPIPSKVLIREICNSIIAQAVRYINGGDIFTMISSEETVECYAKLENTYRICTAFKACAA